MKQIWLIAFFSLFMVHPVHSQQLSEKLSFTCGEKITLPFLTAQSYQTIDDWNFGVNLFFNVIFPSQKKIKLTTKTGNLTTSGSFSKISSPALSSSISPFSKASTKVSIIETGFSGRTVFSKPIAFFQQIDFSSTSINAITDENQNYAAFSIKSQFQNETKTKFNFSVTGGIYHFDSKIPDSWFSQNLFYPEMNVLALNAQGGISFGGFSTIFHTNLYNSPWGQINFSFRNEILLNKKNFSFSLSQFYAPSDLITSSQKNISPLYQIKANIQKSSFHFINAPLLLNFGLTIYSDLKLSTGDFNIKTSSGMKIISDNYSGTLSLNINFSGDLSGNTISDLVFNNFDFTSVSVGIKNYFTTGKIRTNLNGTANFSTDEKNNFVTSQKITAGISFNSKQDFSLGVTTEFYEKNFIWEKTKMSANLSAAFQFPFCILNFHLEFQE
ncbi:MAG: hypothetical protein MJ160_04065 [Treponema sp.]|nr:hypothetical protein [Treponema sp.]